MYFMQYNISKIWPLQHVINIKIINEIFYMLLLLLFSC